MLGRFGKTPEPQEFRPKGFDDYDLRIGDLLRGERATKGKSLADIEKALRIKAHYLAAIENADLSVFDAPSFISGYVRSYARYLGLNPDDVFAQFCGETGFEPTHGMSPAASKPAGYKQPVSKGDARTVALSDAGQGSDTQPNVFGAGYFAPQPQSIFGRMEPGALGSFAVLVAVVGGLAFGGWSVLREVQKVELAPVDIAPVIVVDVPAGLGAAPAARVPAANTAALMPPSLPVFAGLPANDDSAARTAQPQTLEVPILVARDGPISAIDPRKSGILADAVAAVKAQEVAKAETEVTVLQAPKLVEVLASRPSWISITAADGAVLFEKILDAGERYTVPALEVAPRLKAGNSSAIYFVLGDQTYGPASTGPEVVRDIDLSAANVSAKFGLADLSKDADLTAIVAEVSPSAAPSLAE
jgi:cytoskeletal protein RodZ